MHDVPDGPSFTGRPPRDGRRTAVRERFAALENFFRVFAIRPRERVLMLTDPLLDPRVVEAVSGVAAARGASVSVFMAPDTRLPAVPDSVRPLIAAADFVVSTWFCSIEDPFTVAGRRAGQRWVKITYFRDLDLLDTPQARFPQRSRKIGEQYAVGGHRQFVDAVDGG
jgi:hypothetical protein